MVDIIKGFVEGNQYYVSADVEFTKIHGAVGFSTKNMIRTAEQQALQSGRTGSYITYGVSSGSPLPKQTIWEKFTFEKAISNGHPPVPNTFTDGVTIFKNSNSDGIITNVQVINTTPASSTQRYIVNTSATDRNNTVSSISNNYAVNSDFTETQLFYIHARTVNGIRQAVASTDFTAQVNLPVGKYDTVITDLGNAGYYDNVVKVEVNIYYDNVNGKFPNDDTEVSLVITGETTIAIDQ